LRGNRNQATIRFVENRGGDTVSRILENVLKSAIRLKDAGVIDRKTFDELKDACRPDGKPEGKGGR
jgi:hypothetical protein